MPPWIFPDIKFCPACGSQNLEPKFEGWEEHAQKTGGAFGECSDCGTHFVVSGYAEFADEGSLMTEDEYWENLPCPVCAGRRWIDVLGEGVIPCAECNDEDPPLPEARAED